MKTIGFIDYFMDEWHANNYPKMIKAYNEKNGTDYQVKYAWAEIDGPNMTTDEWCAKFGAEKCNSIKEICEKADFIMVLAPSNPETHLKYAEEVFKCGQNPYIDKTFAPDYASAKKIFDLADKYGVKFFSTSALRFSSELDECMNSKVATIVGCGGNFDEYVIHCIEMAVKCLGKGATKVKYEKYSDQEFAEIAYDDGRHAKIVYAMYNPYVVISQDKDGISKYYSIESNFFGNLIADILRFSETKQPSFDTQETLEVIKIREGLIASKEKAGEWKTL